MLQNIKRQHSATVCSHEQTALVFEFFAGIKHFQKHKQHTSKDAEFIALHDQGQFCNQIQCYNTSNDKIQHLYADTNKLHKCLNSLLQLNIFKNTNNTHQNMQNTSIYTITDSSATRFECYNTSNDKIQQLYASTNKLHKCLNFLLELNIFKNTNNTHQNMQNSSLFTMTRVLQPDSNATIQQTTRFCNCMQSRTNCISVLNFLLELNIFKNTNNTHQKMQNSSLYTITPLRQPDSNATIQQTTRFSNCKETRTNCISVWIFCWN